MPKYIKTVDGITRRGEWSLDLKAQQPVYSDEVHGTVIPLSSIIAMGDVFAEVRGRG